MVAGIKDPSEDLGRLLPLPTVILAMILGVFFLWRSIRRPVVQSKSTKTRLPDILAAGYVLVITLVVCFLPLSYADLAEWGIKGRCIIMPCTSVKLEDWDQAFALFAALFFLVYEYGLRFLGFLWLKLTS